MIHFVSNLLHTQKFTVAGSIKCSAAIYEIANNKKAPNNFITIILHLLFIFFLKSKIEVFRLE